MSFKALTIDETIAEISGSRALILCHRNPDADTICSALALCEIIRKTGGRARAVCADYIPSRLRFTAKDYKLRLSPGEEDGKLVIAVDVASPSQLGALIELKNKTSLIIDHHSSCERFADHFADGTASSAGEIIARIYEKMKADGIIDESPRICRYLYAAISSDTGSFKFSNARSATFETAARLVDVINSTKADGDIPIDAMDTSDISRLMFDTRSVAEITGNTVAARNMIVRCDGLLAITSITLSDIAEAGITEDDISGAVDVVRSVAGVLVGISLKEISAGEYRISARSNGDFDVAAVCEKFGGGGHVRAAGGSVKAPTREQALSAVGDAFAAAIEKSMAR